MNIVIINASPRKNGATSKILHLIEQELSAKINVHIDFFNISDMKISYCNGCGNCYKMGKCFIDDDAEKLSTILAVSDGVIIGTPTYVSDVSSQLKTVIDRGHFVIEQLLKGTHGINIVTYENYGGYNALKTLNNLLTFSGGVLSGKLAFKIPFNSDLSKQPKILKTTKKLSQKLYQDISANRIPILSKVKHFIVFNIGIKPFVMSKSNQYQGVLEHWKTRNII